MSIKSIKQIRINVAFIAKGKAPALLTVYGGVINIRKEGRFNENFHSSIIVHSF